MQKPRVADREVWCLKKLGRMGMMGTWLRWQNSGIDFFFFGGVRFLRNNGIIFSTFYVGKKNIQMHDSLDIFEVTRF